MATEWYCKIADFEDGPFSSKELVEMALAGQISPDSQVRKGSAGKWVSARRVKGLFVKHSQLRNQPYSPLGAGARHGIQVDAYCPQRYQTHPRTSPGQPRRTKNNTLSTFAWIGVAASTIIVLAMIGRGGSSSSAPPSRAREQIISDSVEATMPRASQFEKDVAREVIKLDLEEKGL
ncbi:MAG: DUF4339 domain-containing protein [Planctomycetes bacterium]|nr:DUF4339 domain-containing protein [Planctomycetota bacterium]